MPAIISSALMITISLFAFFAGYIGLLLLAHWDATPFSQSKLCSSPKPNPSTTLVLKNAPPAASQVTASASPDPEPISSSLPDPFSTPVPKNLLPAGLHPPSSSASLAPAPRAEHKSVLSKVRIAIIGAAGVGKSALHTRYTKTDQTFSDKYTPTPIMMLGNKTQGTQIWSIWDIAAGPNQQKVLAPIKKGLQAVMVAYAVDDKSSFEHAQAEIARLQQNNPSLPIMLLACKADLCDSDSDQNFDPDFAQAEGYAEETGVLFSATSAKDGRGVEEAFTNLLGVINQHQRAYHQKTIYKGLGVGGLGLG